MAEPSGFHCPDDQAFLSNVFGVLDVTYKNIRLFGKCHVCVRAGRKPNVIATVDIPFHVYEEARWDGAIWIKP